MTKRLLLSYLAVTVIVLAALEIPLAIIYQQRERDRLATDVERDATVLASRYEDVLEAQLPADPAAAEGYAERTGARVVVVDADGLSVIDTEAEVDRDFSTRPEFEAALAGGRSSGTRRSDTLDTDLLFVAVPVASGGNVWGVVRVTLDSQEVSQRIRQVWLALGAVAVVILAAMTGIGFAIARSVTRPIRQLEVAATRFARGELATTEPHPGAPREIRELEETLNRMARQLDAMLQQQRAFVADASHQLRTPLTAIRLRLENLRETLDSPEEQREVDATIVETTRLGALVDDLLMLARAERQAEMVETDLAETVRQRVDTWTASAVQRGVDLRPVTPADALWVESVAGAVEQILDNLLDNAITASAGQGMVTVAVTSGVDAHTVSVADLGSGLTDDEKAHALDRFWRAKSDAAGTGLGLAIVDALVHASGGSLLLRDNEPSGLAVDVSLPAVRPPDHLRDRRA